VGLSKAYKKRIVSSAKLVKSTRLMAEEMSLQNKDYAIEIENIISIIKSENISKSAKQSESSSTNSLTIFGEDTDDDSFFQSKEKENKNTENLNTDPEESDPITIPAWAKEIWREIMKICHPDKLISKELSIEERFLRNSTMENAMAAHDQENWDEILYLGVLLDRFTEKLSGKKQMSKLDVLYNKSAVKIHEIQQSVTWEWGTSWENIEKRVLIISFLLASQNIPVPDKDILIDKISKLDL
tara:strand:+ start:266 stop:991 length:726 start_codon:yes stop_codon:yes gene_type:complete